MECEEENGGIEDYKKECKNWKRNIYENGEKIKGSKSMKKT